MPVFDRALASDDGGIFLIAVLDDFKQIIALRVVEWSQKQVIDEGVVVPNGQFVIPTAYSTKLTGILESPAALFWGVKKAQ